MLRAAILDNSAIARELLRTTLANGGYNVINESRVESADLSHLTLLAPQLIFIALDEENDAALSTLTEVRNSLPKTLIFAVSSAFTAERIKQAIEGGAGGLVVKPFNEATVLSSIRSSVLKPVAQQKAETKF